MKIRKILSTLLVAIMLVTQLGTLGTVSFATHNEADSHALTVTLITGAQIGTDDLEDATEMLSTFRGGTIRLNEDVVYEELIRFDLYSDVEFVIDLNGHLLSGVDVYVSEKASFSVVDTSEGKTGKLESADIDVYFGELLLEDITYEATITIRENSLIVLDGVKMDEGETACFYYRGKNSSVTFKDTVLYDMNVEYDIAAPTLMHGLKIMNYLCVHYVDINGFLGGECRKVTDEDGQSVSLDELEDTYSGVLEITHDDTKIDTSKWYSNSEEHYHKCSCGYKVDCSDHTVVDDKCTVCGADAFIIVNANGSAAKFFNINEALEYAVSYEQATVTLQGDVFCYGNTDIIGDRSDITLDLAGYDLELMFVILDGDKLELTVTDSSAGKDGCFEIEYIDLYGASVLNLEDVRIEGNIYLDDASRLYVHDVISEDFYFSQYSDKTEVIIDGGEFENFYANREAEAKIMLFNLTVSRYLHTYNMTLGDVFDKDCITVDVGSGEPVDFSLDYYYCIDNVLTVTHDDTEFSDQLSGSNGVHGYVCRGCDNFLEFEGCSGGSATCTKKAECSVCGCEYGDMLPHTLGEGGKCSECQTEAIIKVEGDGKTLSFFDFADAVKAAENMTSAKITLLADVKCYEEVEPSTSITFDLNGYDFYVDELNVYADFVIDDGVGTGSFSSDDEIDVYLGATLTVETVNFSDYDFYIDLKDEGATVVINDGVFSCLMLDMDEENSTIIINGIEVEDLYIDYYDNSLIVIKGGYFSMMPYIDAEDGHEIEDVLSADCITIYDINGDEISLEQYLEDPYMSVTIEHDDTYSGVSYAGTKEGHYAACACGYGQSDTLLPHSGGTYNCESKKECVECGYEYGLKAPHSFVNGVCTECGDRELIKVNAEGFSQSFGNLEDAFEAAAAQQNATIILLDHVVITDTYTHALGGNITIDLAGYTLAVSNFVFYSTSVTLVDSSAEKTGAIIGYDFVAEKGSTFNISSGNVYSNLFVYSATVTVNGGVFLDVPFAYVGTNGVLDIRGGVFRDEAFLIQFIDDNVSAAISGGVFEKGIEIYMDSAPLSDLLPETGCYVFRDENGNAIDMTKGIYEGYMTVENTCSYELKYDENGHWYECTACGDKKSVEAHANADGDGKCDGCGYVMKTDGLGVGAIVGISVGSAVVLGVGGFSLFWFVIKKKSIADLIAVFKK